MSGIINAEIRLFFLKNIINGLVYKMFHKNKFRNNREIDVYIIVTKLGTILVQAE